MINPIQSNAAYTFPQTIQKPVAGGYMFSQIFEQTRNTHAAASTDAAQRAAAVRAGLDSETLMWLDKYSEIYNKYAARYGDGFELDPQKNNAATAFRDELTENIPRDVLGLLPLEEIETEYICEAFSKILNPEAFIRFNNTCGIATVFYAEKYGVSGLTKKEQTDKIMSAVTNNLEFGGAVQKLVQLGLLPLAAGRRGQFARSHL